MEEAPHTAPDESYYHKRWEEVHLADDSCKVWKPNSEEEHREEARKTGLDPEAVVEAQSYKFGGSYGTAGRDTP